MVTETEPNVIRYGDEPRVLLFADAPAARATLGTIIETYGGRVVAALPLVEAIDRLELQLSIDAVVVDVGEETGAGEASIFAGLVTRLNEAAAAGRYPSVVIVPPAMIDAAAALAPHADVALLCAPSQIEQVAAIGTALAEREMVLADVSSEGSTPRLRQLSEEVSRIARVLAAMSGEDAGSPALPKPEPAARRGGDAIIDALQVRAMIRARRMRELYFTADLFADPAWDMLLDLMAARLERRQVAVSSLCIAAAVPPTTALRWIKLLTDKGILLRIADPTDGRRVFIELADNAAEGMMNYLAAAQHLATITP